MNFRRVARHSLRGELRHRAEGTSEFSFASLVPLEVE